MKKHKDPDYVIKVEKAIAKKYGSETVQHPRSQWSEEKEKKYLEELKQQYNHRVDEGEVDKVEVNGVFITKKLLNNESKRSCPICNCYSFKSNDDVYMTKFGCCEKCYIIWIEGREDRWLKGWRPHNETNNKTSEKNDKNST